MTCDMCGKEGVLVRALIEGTELNVCGKCAKYGKTLGNVSKPVIHQPKIEKPRSNEPMTVINPNFSTLVKQKREQLGLKQEELAKALSEKESLIQKIESGVVPSMGLARKLELFLRIKLVEEYREETDVVQKSKNVELTLGDFIRVKKK